jgi:sarcosine oxidase, subunit alpha
MSFIHQHPRLEDAQIEEVTIHYDGTPIKTRKGVSVAAALMEQGVKKLGESRKMNQSRGVFCASGRCHSCFVTINGAEHVRSCMVPVEDHMEIYPNLRDPDVRSSCHED